MSRSHLLCALCALLFVSAPVSAVYQPFDYAFDDFNRAASSNMGAAWQERQADFYTLGNVSDGQAQCSNYALMEYIAPTAMQPTDWISVDAEHNSSMTPQYVGLVLGYADLLHNIQVRLQDNNGSGRWNRILFKYGNGSTATNWSPVGTSSVDLPGNYTNIRMRARLGGNNVLVQLDTNTDGKWERSYQLPGFANLTLGTGFGLTAAGQPFMDNVGAYTLPEPASAVLLMVGTLALRRRNRGRN